MSIKSYFSNKKNIYEVMEAFKINGITIPIGFKSDGHSVPWVFRWLVSNHNLPIEAAIYHDYMYIYNPTGESRSVVDKLYHTVMRNTYNVTWYHSGIAWVGVRLASWYWWNKLSKTHPKRV